MIMAKATHNDAAYTVHTINSKELVKLDSVKAIRKVAYAKNRIEQGTVRSVSILTTDNVTAGQSKQSKIESVVESTLHFLPPRVHYRVFLRQQEQGKDPFGFMVYSWATHTGQVAEEEAVAAFHKITTTLAPILDAGYVVLNKQLLKKIILPAPKEPEKLTFHILALMRHQPRLYHDWIKLLQSLLEFASAKDDDKAVKALLLEGADPHSTGGRKFNLVHALVQQKSMKTIAALVSHDSALALDVPDYSEQLSGEEDAKNEADNGPEVDDMEEGEIRHQRHETQLPRKLSYIKIKDLLNVFDGHNMTPLMLSVQDLQIDSTLQLLMGGADPNIPQPSTGDTALHMATQLGSVQLVKLIIAYGGGIDTLNRKSQTPIDIAKEQGNDEIVAVLEEVKAAEDIAKEAEGMDVKLEPDSLSLLSLDGGGIRSMITAQVLLAIEKKMKALDPSCKSIMDYFDYVAGTSMGGTVAAGMIMGSQSLANVHTLIFTACNRVFLGKKENRVHEIESCIAEVVGANTKMAQRKKPRLIITAAMIDRSPSALHLFTNFGESDNNQPSPEDQDVCGVLRATMAAPYYSPPYKGIFADGGLAANNPTLAAMAKIFDQMKKEKSIEKLGCVVSLGTGDIPPKPVHDNNVFLPSFSDAVLHARGKLSGITNLLEILMSKVLESNGQPVVEAHAWCESLSIPFFRLNPALQKNVGFNSIDCNDVINLLYSAHLYNLREASTIETVAQALLSRSNIVHQ